MALKITPGIVRYDGENRAPLLEEALAVLDRGGVVAAPTDTVYGLLGRADRPEAVRKIYRLKGRDRRKPLVLMAAGSADDLIAEPSEIYRRLSRRFWPGGLTLVVGASPRVKGWGLDSQGTTGIRCPADSFLEDLIQRAGVPLASTSANRSGQPECFTAREVLQSLKTPPDLLIDGGQRPPAQPSTVLDISRHPPVILRKGAITRAAIEDCCQARVRLANIRVLFVCTGNTCRSPMAEGWLKQRLPKNWRGRIVVESAGTSALPGLPAAENARLAVRARGGDISSHRSQPLSRDLIASADIVVAMEEHHRQAVLDLWPGAEAIMMDEAGVPDPIGGDRAEYDRTLEAIAKGMPRVLKWIEERLYIS